MRTLFVVLCCILAVQSAAARELKPYAGSETPALALADLNGRPHNLRDYKGQVVLVNFWATWCPPCRAEMPSMQRLKGILSGQRFAILAVDMGEEPEAVRAFLREIKVDFPILMDRDGEVLRRWKVFAFPTSFVLDPQGRIRYALFGSTEWDDPDTVAKIRALLPPSGGRRPKPSE